MSSEEDIPTLKKVNRVSSDSEPEIIPQKKFRKKISTKSSGKDFFDFNDGFTKAKPKLSRNESFKDSEPLQNLPKDSQISKESTESIPNKESEYISSDHDGSISPLPIIFQDSDELKNVFSRISKLDTLKKDSSLANLPSRTTQTNENSKIFKVSVSLKKWPDTQESEIYSDSLKSNESFNQLLSKI